MEEPSSGGRPRGVVGTPRSDDAVCPATIPACRSSSLRAAPFPQRLSWRRRDRWPRTRRSTQPGQVSDFPRAGPLLPALAGRRSRPRLVSLRSGQLRDHHDAGQVRRQHQPHPAAHARRDGRVHVHGPGVGGPPRRRDERRSPVRRISAVRDALHASGDGRARCCSDCPRRMCDAARIHRDHHHRLWPSCLAAHGAFDIPFFLPIPPAQVRRRRGRRGSPAMQPRLRVRPRTPLPPPRPRPVFPTTLRPPCLGTAATLPRAGRRGTAQGTPPQRSRRVQLPTCTCRGVASPPQWSNWL